MTFEEFADEVDASFKKYRGVMRYGQTLMDVLYGVWPEKYNEITSSEEDCFYLDSMVPKVMEKLEREWDESGTREKTG